MRKSAAVTVRVPATTANCGPGFDALGIACSLYNELEVVLLSQKKIEIEILGEGAQVLPTDERNLVWQVIRDVIKKAKVPYQGAAIKMRNNIPLSRGLGSSAAAIVGGIAAATCAIGEPLAKKDILEMAAAIEGHPDNVAPAVYGGITASLYTYPDVKTVSFLPKFSFKMAAAVPNFFLPTKKARAALPESVPLKDAVFNISHVGSLVASLFLGDTRLFAAALDDRIHQPYRAELIPGMYDVFAAAKKAGALGAVLSGAGPALIAFCTDNEEEVGKAMVSAFAEHDVKADYLLLDIDNKGVQRI